MFARRQFSTFVNDWSEIDKNKLHRSAILSNDTRLSLPIWHCLPYTPPRLSQWRFARSHRQHGQDQQHSLHARKSNYLTVHLFLQHSAQRKRDAGAVCYVLWCLRSRKMRTNHVINDTGRMWKRSIVLTESTRVLFLSLRMFTWYKPQVRTDQHLCNFCHGLHMLINRDAVALKWN